MMNMPTIIVSICSALLGGSGIGIFMYYRETKKSKNLDNDRKELDNEKQQAERWRELYIEAERKSQAKSIKIEKLYEIIDSKTAKIIELEGRIARIALLRCDEVGCPARKPPINTINTN